MADLLDEMMQCQSVRACIDLALTDAYGEEEEAVAWLTCIEAMFDRHMQVRLLGNDVALIGFDLRHHDVVCRVSAGQAQSTRDSGLHRVPRTHAGRAALAEGLATILGKERLIRYCLGADFKLTHPADLVDPGMGAGV